MKGFCSHMHVRHDLARVGYEATTLPQVLSNAYIKVLPTLSPTSVSSSGTHTDKVWSLIALCMQALICRRETWRHWRAKLLFREMVDDLRDLIVSGRRASQRQYRLEWISQRTYGFVVAPSYVVAA
jgi:hypothetical protein